MMNFLVVRQGFLRPLAVLLMLLPLALASPAPAQDVTAEEVLFPRGKDQVTRPALIWGPNQWLFVIRGEKGKRLQIDLKSRSPSVYFNVSGTGPAGMLHIGAMSGNRFDAALTATDDYQVLVYLTHAEAMKNGWADVEVTFRLTRPEPPKPEPGGEFREVHGIPNNAALPVRVVPSNPDRAVGLVRNGDVVRSLGCAGVGENRWCEIVPAKTPTPGWVQGIYLRRAAVGEPVPPRGDGRAFEATGTLPCAARASEERRDCAYGIIYGRQPGTAVLWVATGRDTQRLIRFEDGVPVFADGPGALTYEVAGRLILISVGREVYDVKVALIKRR